MTPAVRNTLMQRLIKEEGEKRLPNGNHALYRDSKGIYTIGHGYNIEDNGLPDELAKDLLGRSMQGAEQAAEGISGYLGASPARQSVVIAMVYQMGLGKVLGFHEFCKALAANDYDTAANEMLDSDWHRKDSPARAEREAWIMRTGNLP